MIVVLGCRLHLLSLVIWSGEVKGDMRIGLAVNSAINNDSKRDYNQSNYNTIFLAQELTCAEGDTIRARWKVISGSNIKARNRIIIALPAIS